MEGLGGLRGWRWIFVIVSLDPAFEVVSVDPD
jgi:hypothetical protein